MIVRVFATVCWIGIAGIGVHMMRTPVPYENWAMVAKHGDGFVHTMTEFSQSTLDSLGGINTGRILTIMGVCMIAGTWIPKMKRKKLDDLNGAEHCARGDEKILIGEAAEEPVYEFRI